MTMVELAPGQMSVLDLETLKETIRLEIRKELKIKEGAEKLMKASVDRKSKAYVSTILKNCDKKLEALHSELSDLQAQVPDDDGKWQESVLGTIIMHRILVLLMLLFFFFPTDYML